MTQEDQGGGVQAAERASSILTALVAARKALRFYPASNPRVAQALDRLTSLLTRELDRGRVLSFQIDREQLLVDDEPVRVHDAELGRIALKLHFLSIERLSFEPGFAGAEVVPLLEVLSEPYEGLCGLTDLNQLLAERGVRHASVSYSKRRVLADSDTELPLGELDPSDAESVFKPSRMLELLRDPQSLVRELVRLCARAAAGAGQRKLDAQLRFIDAYLMKLARAVEAAPAAERAEYYDRMREALDAFAGALSRSSAPAATAVQLEGIDPGLLEALPESDVVKEVSKKVRPHQGTAAVVARAIEVAPIADIIDTGERSSSVVSNLEIIDEFHVGADIDGEYPGIAFAERDRGKNFDLDMPVLIGELSAAEKTSAREAVDGLVDLRPHRVIRATLRDMLANEGNARLGGQVVERLLELLGSALDAGEVDAALDIVKGLSAERGRRQAEPEFRAAIDDALERIAGRDELKRVFHLADNTPAEDPRFARILDYLYLLDRGIVHILLDLLEAGEIRLGRRRS